VKTAKTLLVSVNIDPRTGFIFGGASRPKDLNVEFVPRSIKESMATEKRKADVSLHEILSVRNEGVVKSSSVRTVRKWRCRCLRRRDWHTGCYYTDTRGVV
jgi:hypothetical protein